MKNLAFFALIVLSCLQPVSIHCQSSTQCNDLYYQMQLAFNSNSTILWDKSIEDAMTVYELSENPEDLLTLCYAYYGAIGSLMITRDKTRGTKLLSEAMNYAQALQEHESYKSQALALIGGFQGLEIGLSPMKGMFLGAKSDNNIDLALKLDKNNSFAWLQKGSSQFHTPKMFGGSVEQSIVSFQESILLHRKYSNSPEWLKIEAMIWLGQALADRKRYNEAHKVFSEVLAIDKNVTWVSEQLLPKIKDKI